MSVSCLSPFRWKEFPQPSIFMADPAFYKGARTGQTMGAIQSQAMSRFEEREGRSAGTIEGLSAKTPPPRKRSASHYGSKA